MTRVKLRPKILFGGDKRPTPADLEWLHDKGSAQRRAGTRLRDATVEPIVGASCRGRSHARLRGQIPKGAPLPPDDAHRECFIANSVLTQVMVVPAA